MNDITETIVGKRLKIHPKRKAFFDSHSTSFDSLPWLVKWGLWPAYTTGEWLLKVVFCEKANTDAMVLRMRSAFHWWDFRSRNKVEDGTLDSESPYCSPGFALESHRGVRMMPFPAMVRFSELFANSDFCTYIKDKVILTLSLYIS